MKLSDFLNNQTEETKKVFETLDSLIRMYDNTVTAEVGSIMSIKEAVIYKQDNVFKYGLAVTKNHFSYHSMVMYAYPKTIEEFKTTSKGIKFQKGCFNFKALENINLSSFESFLKDSAKQDFSPVINHYKNKKK